MKINKIYVIAFLAVLVMAVLSACDGTTDYKQELQTERLAAEADAKVGFPVIVNFREKRLVKDLYEMRDRSDLLTYTYIVDFDGNLIWFCDSIGYGIPYSTQFSNPERTAYSNLTLPQPEPNGLFIPTGLSATWIQCVNPDTKQIEPQYVEPQIVVSTYKR